MKERIFREPQRAAQGGSAKAGRSIRKSLFGLFLFGALAVCGACEEADEVLTDRLAGEWTADYTVQELSDSETGRVDRFVDGFSGDFTTFNFVDRAFCDIVWRGTDYGTVLYRLSDSWVFYSDCVGKYELRISGDQMRMLRPESTMGTQTKRYEIHLLRKGAAVPRSRQSSLTDGQLTQKLLGKWQWTFDMDWTCDPQSGAFIHSGSASLPGHTIEFRADGTCVTDMQYVEGGSERAFTVSNGRLAVAGWAFDQGICFTNGELRLFYEYASTDPFEPRRKYTNYCEWRLVRMRK